MSTGRQKWYYPNDIANDLQDIDIPSKFKAETLACAWEYTRCVIPQYTNWSRYVAFMRIIVMGIVCEVKGALIDVAASDDILGYHLDASLSALFEGTPGHAEMAREYKTFLLITGEKTSERRNGELFRRYVNALSSSPECWFRMRDCDALARFSIAAALACNDLDDIWFTEEQWQVLAEIGTTLYDAVAFYKHRAEGETNNTFAYAPESSRVEAFGVAREVLWALDTASAKKPEGVIAVNFVRFFGGPIHAMMRRYRFVEEELSIGKPEGQAVVQQTRDNFKLWNRVDANETLTKDHERYDAMLAREGDLMFPGFAGILKDNGDGGCSQCYYRQSYGATSLHCFGGVSLCESCRDGWGKYLTTLPERAKRAFPDLELDPALPDARVGTDASSQHQSAMNEKLERPEQLAPVVA